MDDPRHHVVSWWTGQNVKLAPADSLYVASNENIIIEPWIRFYIRPLKERLLYYLV